MEITAYNYDSHSDQRGTLLFCNALDLTPVRRNYLIDHVFSGDVRAWQGHRTEMKWFTAIRGKFLINLVRIDNWENPSENLKVTSYILSANELQTLHIPAGYANGIMSLEDHSRLQVFSSASIQEGMNDNFKFDTNRWFDWDEFKKSN